MDDANCGIFNRLCSINNKRSGYSKSKQWARTAQWEKWLTLRWMAEVQLPAGSVQTYPEAYLVTHQAGTHQYTLSIPRLQGVLPPHHYVFLTWHFGIRGTTFYIKRKKNWKFDSLKQPTVRHILRVGSENTKSKYEGESINIMTLSTASTQQFWQLSMAIWPTLYGNYEYYMFRHAVVQYWVNDYIMGTNICLWNM
jgi:hypothetical protein